MCFSILSYSKLTSRGDAVASGMILDHHAAVRVELICVFVGAVRVQRVVLVANRYAVRGQVVAGQMVASELVEVAAIRPTASRNAGQIRDHAGVRMIHGEIGID